MNGGFLTDTSSIVILIEGVSGEASIGISARRVQ